MELVPILVQQDTILYSQTVLNVKSPVYYVLHLRINVKHAYQTIIFIIQLVQLIVQVVITIIYSPKHVIYADHHAKHAQMKTHALVAGPVGRVPFLKAIHVLLNVFQDTTGI